MISHSQDFLNGVCTNIIHMHKGKLLYYGVRAKINLGDCYFSHSVICQCASLNIQPIFLSEPV